MSDILLSSGEKMPVIGLGTWKSLSNDVISAVEYALAVAGYRHIDCAAIYRNEFEIGQTFKKVFSTGKIKRDDVFVTSKLWITEFAKQDVLKACQVTLRNLQLDYLDLYLMHWGVAALPDPSEPGLIKNAREEWVDEGVLRTAPVSIRETWEAMQELVNKGLVRSIGVSNFTAPMIVDLLTYAKIPPAVNQIELHPYNQQVDLVDYCHSKGIAVTAYSPLGNPGRAGAKDPSLVKEKTICAIAKAHKKSPAQVLIRWALQRNTIVIPKSISAKHLKENSDVFDFNLSRKDMEEIAKIDRGFRFVNPYDWWKIPYFG